MWAAVRRQDTMLLKELLQVLQAVAEAVLPLLTPLQAVELWSDDDAEQGAAAHTVLDPGECKHAVLLCLRLLLVQLPGSASVPLLIRGRALEVSSGHYTFGLRVSPPRLCTPSTGAKTVGCGTTCMFLV